MVEEGRRYTEDDFNRIIEIEEREQYRVKLFMGAIDQHQKTLVFCATQEHALACILSTATQGRIYLTNVGSATSKSVC